MHSQSPQAQGFPTIARAVVIATVAVALLDATDGVVYYWLTAGMNPIQVLQYIASGALGSDSFHGGLATAFVGLIFHFVISLAAVSVFAGLYLRLQAVYDFPFVAGLVYGLGVWTFMNLVVLPLTSVPASAFSPLFVSHGLVGHALFVGLATAIVIRRYLGAPVGLGNARVRGAEHEMDPRVA